MFTVQGVKFIVDNEREKGSRALTPAEYEAIVNDQKAVFVYGEGRYEDLSGNKYDLDTWAFRWTKKFGFVNDPTAIPIYEQTLADAKRKATDQF